MNAVSAGVKRPPSEATACPLSGPRLVYAGAGVDTIVATGADRPLPGAPSALTGRAHEQRGDTQLGPALLLNVSGILVAGPRKFVVGTESRLFKVTLP